MFWSGLWNNSNVMFPEDVSKIATLSDGVILALVIFGALSFAVFDSLSGSVKLTIKL